MGRIPALTSVRFIAAFLVFFHHYICFGGYRHFNLDSFWDIQRQGDVVVRLIFEMRYGVTLFFVLSGFLLAARYYDKIFVKISFKEYWIKRFARIFPLYWTLCIILFGFYFFTYFTSINSNNEALAQQAALVEQAQSLPTEEQEAALAEAAAMEIPKVFDIQEMIRRAPVFFSLTQGYFFWIKFSGIGVAWSLTVEETFYLVLPVILVLISLLWAVKFPVREAYQQPVKFILLLIGLVLLSFGFFELGKELLAVDWNFVWNFFWLDKIWLSKSGDGYLVHYGFFQDRVRGDRDIRWMDMRIYTIFGRFFDFAVGIFFGMVYLKTKNALLNKQYLADIMIVVGAIGVVITCITLSNNGGLETRTGWSINFINSVLSGIILYFLCSAKSLIASGLSWRPFVYLGEISFALYLIHSNDMVDWLYRTVTANEVNFALAMFGLYALFTVLSVIAYEVVERPSQHVILTRSFGLQKRRRPTILRIITRRRHD